MTQAQREMLIQAAVEARTHAYAPYSKFKVGAALWTPWGSIIQGANIENASFGLTNCAERVAVATASAAGQREFDAIAVAAPGSVTPCGACRQVLAEFCDDLLVLLIDADQPNAIRETTLRELLPEPFGDLTDRGLKDRVSH